MWLTDLLDGRNMHVLWLMADLGEFIGETELGPFLSLILYLFLTPNKPLL